MQSYRRLFSNMKFVSRLFSKMKIISQLFSKFVLTPLSSPNMPSPKCMYFTRFSATQATSFINGRYIGDYFSKWKLSCDYFRQWPPGPSGPLGETTIWATILGNNFDHKLGCYSGVVRAQTGQQSARETQPSRRTARAPPLQSGSCCAWQDMANTSLNKSFLKWTSKRRWVQKGCSVKWRRAVNRKPNYTAYEDTWPMQHHLKSVWSFVWQPQCIQFWRKMVHSWIKRGVPTHPFPTPPFASLSLLPIPFLDPAV